MLRNGVQAIAHVTHVVREEEHHQLFNLLLVFVVHGMHVHVDGDKLRHGTYLTLLLHRFEVAVNHGEKFQRVHFLAIANPQSPNKFILKLKYSSYKYKNKKYSKKIIK